MITLSTANDTPSVPELPPFDEDEFDDIFDRLEQGDDEEPPVA